MFTPGALFQTLISSKIPGGFKVSHIEPQGVLIAVVASNGTENRTYYFSENGGSWGYVS